MISIIDDDASVRTSISSFLRSLGYSVQTFASAEEFLQSGRLKEAACVIADVKMPGMSGVDLQALENRPQVGANDPRFVGPDLAPRPVEQFHGVRR